MAAPTGAAFITAPTWDAGTSLFASVDDEGASAGASGTNESSQSTLLLKKRREMGEVEEQLAKLQAETTIKMAQCDERERILVKNQKKESDHVERCHKYIDENDRKRERAEMKVRVRRHTHARLACCAPRGQGSFLSRAPWLAIADADPLHTRQRLHTTSSAHLYRPRLRSLRPF